MSVPVSYAGIISMIISVGTVISSLQSDRLTKKLGAGMVTAISVAMTAVALFGFSISGSFPILCLWAIPYGLGAGSVDAALNNYVALHYTSRDMSWLHCMWGVGTIVGPYVMGYALTNGMTWNRGYLIISLIQVVLSAALFLSLPIWRKMEKRAGTAVPEEGASSGKALTLKEIIRIPGAKEIMVTFFCYCAVEQTSMLWGSSYMVLHNGLTAEEAASYASLFCIGITVGRFFNGFLMMRFTDNQMIRAGQAVIIAGDRDPAPSLRKGYGSRRTDPDRAGMCAGLSLHHPFHTGQLRGRQVPGTHRSPDGERLRGELPDASGVRTSGKPYLCVSASVVSSGDHGTHGDHAHGSDQKDA